jgi:hypothetical protein
MLSVLIGEHDYSLLSVDVFQQLGEFGYVIVHGLLDFHREQNFVFKYEVDLFSSFPEVVELFSTRKP